MMNSANRVSPELALKWLPLKDVLELAKNSWFVQDVSTPSQSTDRSETLTVPARVS